MATDTVQAVHQKFIKSAAVKSVDKQIREMPWGEKLFYANDLFGNLFALSTVKS
jgi:uncharacterized glyoxalase superfamily protein PhnB